MVTSLPAHPEERGQPVITVAVQGILIDQFRDELQFGVHDYPDANHKSYLEDSARILVKIKGEQAAGRSLSWTDLLLCQAYECAGKEDPAQLYIALTSLGATVVQWMESLNRRYGGQK